jgi:hypothetical protein
MERRPTSRRTRFSRDLFVENWHFIGQKFLDVVLAREAPQFNSRYRGGSRVVYFD